MFAMGDLGFICAMPFLLILGVMFVKLLRNIAKQNEERELKKIDPKAWAEMKRMKMEQERKASDAAAGMLGAIARKILDK
jgi:hypothetical protein